MVFDLLGYVWDLLLGRVCLPSQHEPEIVARGERLRLRCRRCGRVTQGWDLSAKPPKRTYEGETRRRSTPDRERVSPRSVMFEPEFQPANFGWSDDDEEDDDIEVVVH